MTKEKRDIINGILVFVIGLLIAIAAIATETGSMDDQVGWECER